MAHIAHGNCVRSVALQYVWHWYFLGQSGVGGEPCVFLLRVVGILTALRLDKAASLHSTQDRHAKKWPSSTDGASVVAVSRIAVAIDLEACSVVIFLLLVAIDHIDPNAMLVISILRHNTGREGYGTYRNRSIRRSRYTPVLLFLLQDSIPLPGMAGDAAGALRALGPSAGGFRFRIDDQRPAAVAGYWTRSIGRWVDIPGSAS